ncbi:hypothetical protein J2S46_008020 [Kitasatospora herbaricolor]|nr:hypothetical protein [Kitasatospora herbaricolor]
MLQRLAGPKLGLCEAPVIHEAWTAYSTENILESFRQALGSARDTAIAENDFVTLEYVKAMYSKFVSTIGPSTANHKMRLRTVAHRAASLRARSAAARVGLARLHSAHHGRRRVVGGARAGEHSGGAAHRIG